jgi:hypothetical protein
MWHLRHLAVVLGLAACSMAPVAEPPQPVAYETLLDEGRARAIAAAKRGDFKEAERELRKLTAAGESLEGDPALETRHVHLELTWLRWADGDFAGAQKELEQARRAHRRSRAIGNMSVYMGVYERWVLAFLLREAAEVAPAASRREALSAASAARRDHDEAADPVGRQYGIALLGALFAVRAGDAMGALAAATSAASLADEPEPPELYVVALAFDLGGDHARAEALRRDIRAKKDDILSLVVARRMDADAARSR